MNILVIEDDENKRSQLEGFIQISLPEARVTTAKSLQGGLRAIISGDHDLVILDMTMPTYDIGIDEDGGRPQAYAGREILRQLDRREMSLPVVVVTQFDRFGEGAEALTLGELDKQLWEQHPHNYKGSVYYNPALEGWKDALCSIISKISSEEGGTQEC